MENVELEFREEALREVAKKSIARKAGARGLRSILEHVLLDTMFDLPSKEGLTKVVVDEASIKGESEPIMIYESSEQNRAVSE